MREPLLGGQASWRTVDDAQRADVVTVGGQRRARVKTDVRRSRDQGAVGKARIRPCIRNLQHRIAEHGNSAHGTRPERFLQLHAMARLEPLPLVIHERDQSDRRRQQARRHPGDAIENGFGRGIEDGALAQDMQARALVRVKASARIALAGPGLIRRCSDHRFSLSHN